MNNYLLGDLADTQTGPFGSQLHEEDYVLEGTPIVTVEHLGEIGFTTQNLPYVSERDTKRLSKFLLKEGDIVFSRVGSIDRCVYVKKEQEGWLFSGRCLRVRCNNEKVNSRFLSYYFKLKQFKKMMLNISVGATMPSLNTKLMDSIQLTIPKRETQDAVASILNSIELKIENNNKINFELESVAKDIYEHWFLQFDFPNEEGKPYKSSGGKMVWNEELKREIPAGWKSEKIGELLGRINKTKTYNVSDYSKGSKYPIIDQSKEYICGFTDDGNSLVDLDDCIVFGDHTKIVKYINFPFARGADGTQIITSTRDELPNYLLYQQISNMELVSQGYSRYFKFLKDKFVLVPDMYTARTYMKKVDYMLKMICKNRMENYELAKLRDFLLPLLMNGQVGFRKE